MIDIENKVIDTVINAFSGESVLVVSEYVESPSEFPCVMVLMTGNSTYTRTQDNSLTEHHAKVSFQIDTFSNIKSGAKLEAKRLLDIADAAMQGMKFTRTYYNFFPNEDRSISRCVARYTAIVEKGKTVGNDTVYQMYR